MGFLKKMGNNIKLNLKKRNTSFELMRIIAMLMVCAYHWQLHGNNDMIPRSLLSANQIISFIFGSWGVLGVNLFFLLSFYFLIKKNNITYSKYIKLAIKVSFFGTVTYIIGILCGITEFSFLEIIRTILGVFANQYWFMTVYIIVSLLSPLLNRLLKTLTQKESYVLIAIMIYITYGISWIDGNELVGRLSCGITIYILIYILENKITNNWFEKYRKLAVPLFIMGVVGEIVLSYLSIHYNYLFYKMIQKIQTTNSPYMLLIALMVFYIFKNLRLNYNSLVNILGKYSAGAYLLHGGASFIKDYLWDGLFKVDIFYYLNPIIYMCHYAICILSLFVVGVICDFIYSQVADIIENKIIKFK